MQALKTNFTDRLEAQAEAKKALLAKLKPKPMIRAVEPVDREAEKRADVERIRAERATAKKAKEDAKIAAAAAEEQARMMAKAAEVQAKIEAETSEDEMKRAERKERKAAMKTAAREKRELKSMMRR
jgi:hypothetical protein